MSTKNDTSVAVYIPKEYIGELSKVILAGLQEAKISKDTKKNLKYWWTAEYTILQDSIDS
jgi:hypothetical protein